MASRSDLIADIATILTQHKGLLGKIAKPRGDYPMASDDVPGKAAAALILEGLERRNWKFEKGPAGKGHSTSQRIHKIT